MKSHTITPEYVRGLRLDEHNRETARLLSAVLDDPVLTDEAKRTLILEIVKRPFVYDLTLEYAYGAYNIALARHDYDVAQLWQVEIYRLQSSVVVV